MDCVLCTAIACTQIQERALTEVYFLLSFAISGFIYPVVLAWIHGDGWLKRFGFYESGIGSAVLVVGGTTGFVMNMMIGSRYGIFYKHAV
jgi:ammonia channel protein AmtB